MRSSIGNRQSLNPDNRCSNRASVMFQVTRSDAFPIPITEPAAKVAMLLPDRLGPTMQIMKDWHPARESNGAAKAVHRLHVNIDDKLAALPTVDRQRFQSPAIES